MVDEGFLIEEASVADSDRRAELTLAALVRLVVDIFKLAPLGMARSAKPITLIKPKRS